MNIFIPWIRLLPNIISKCSHPSPPNTGIYSYHTILLYNVRPTPSDSPETNDRPNQVRKL